MYVTSELEPRMRETKPKLQGANVTIIIISGGGLSRQRSRKRRDGGGYEGLSIIEKSGGASLSQS